MWPHERAGGGGAPLAWLGASGVGRSPTPDCPCLQRAAGVRYPLALGAGGMGLGTRHQPLSARSCELALHVAGAARGCLWRGPSSLDVGRPGWGALSRPTVRLWACSRALSLTCCWCGGCGRGDPSSTPQQVLLRAGFARCGAAQGRPGGGGTSCTGVRCPGLGALPRRTARPRGVRPGPITRLLWVPGAWVWGPVTNPIGRALARWRCALWWRHKGARGEASLA